jgi:DHA2 family multidrug resistance protein-like MFS transporter
LPAGFHGRRCAPRLQRLCSAAFPTRAEPLLNPTIHPDGLPKPQRYWAMIAIAVAVTMAVLDSAVANIALPAIARQLGIAPAESVWIINAYQLAIVVLLLPLAALGERIGYRRVYLAGLGMFTAGSLACALSGTLEILVIARIAQGLGAAGIMAVNGALVRFTFPQASLGRGVGLNALVVSVAGAIGPTVASGILAIGPWQWLFAVNVPIGLANLVLAARVLPWSNLSNKAVDWLSATLSALTFGLFFIGVDTLTHGNSQGALATVEMVLAVLAGFTLFRRERHEARPLIPIDLLRIPVFALSTATSICSFAAYTLAFLALPFWFQAALHRDQVQTGLLMTPWPVGVGLVAPFAGRLADRVPAAILGSAGLLVLAIGLGLLSMLQADATSVDIMWRMALCGLGFGFFQAPNNRTMLGSAPRDRAGAAGGMLATARLTGMTGGATIAALVFRMAPMDGEHVCLLIAVVLAVGGCIVSLSRLGKRGAAATA